MTYSNDIIKVLLSVRLLFRKRNVVKTVFEVLMPVMLFFIAFSIRHYITDSKKGQDDHNTYPMHQDELFYLFSNTPMNIAYASNKSQFVRDLMDRVSEKIDLDSFNLMSYENEFVLLDDLKELLMKNTKYMAVIFDNYGDDIPKSINYTIRNSAMYETYKTTPTTIIPGPHEKNGMLYEKFSTLQLAIDLTFIEMATSKSITKKTSFQSFPYPPYNKDEGWTIKYNAILPFITINSYLFLIIATTAKIMVEKASGIKELMKMMGLPEKYVWITYYIDSMFFQIFPLCIVITLLKCDSLVPNTSSIILFFTYFIYTNYVIIFSFTLSTFLSDSTLLNLFAIMIWLFSQLFHLINFKVMEDSCGAYFFMFIPNMPILRMFDIIRVREFQDTGVQFNNLFTPINNIPASNYGVILLILFFKSFLLIPVIYLMNRVNPGPYGVPKSLLSIFYKSKRNCNEGGKIQLQNSTYFEESSGNAIEIQIRNVTKCYNRPDGSPTVALSDVSLDIYKNGITALLGHNGAGKTTLMSIITGMQAATKGKIYINCYDTSNAMDKIYKIIGLCPQHNMTFPYLTVREHVLLFAKIRGFSHETAENECNINLSRLNLIDKANDLCTSISGGAQRRLQLAIALAGHPKVLILDEPTSGLDPKNRREIWDILLELRKDHTILLTTHFMEEADFLGDNIAILDHGMLKCYGTPLYLKNNICKGFKLTILKNPDYSLDLINNAIKNVVKDFVVNSEKDVIIYTINTDDFQVKFKLMDALENDQNDLGLKTFSLSLPTLEEVFLKICSDFGYTSKIESQSNEPSNKQTNLNVEEEIHHSGYSFRNEIENRYLFNMLYILRALINKKLIFMKTRKIIFIPLYFVLFVHLLTAVFLFDSEQYEKLNKNPLIKLNPSIYKNRELLVPYSSVNDTFVPKYPSQMSDLQFLHTDDTYQTILQFGKENILDYSNRLLFGFSFDQDDNTVFYTTSIYHVLPVAVNTLSNIIAMDMIGSNSFPYISVYNHPITENALIENKSVKIKPDYLIMVWAFLITMGFKLFTSGFLMFPIEEQTSGARELQLMTGINKYLYWFSNYSLDLSICLITLVSFVVIMQFETYNTVNTDALVPLLLILTIYLIAMLSFIYLISYYISDAASGFVYLTILNIFSCILALIMYTQSSLDSGNNPIYLNVVYFIIGIFPAIHMDLGFLNIGYLAHERAYCIQQHDLMMSRLNYTKLMEYCCERDEVTGNCSGLPDYYHHPKFGVYVSIVYLCILFVIYTFLLALLQGLFEIGVRNKLSHSKVDISENTPETKKMQTDNEDSPIMLVENVTKNFIVREHITSNRKIEAVKELTMNLHQGECFGLIGLNGAGKTTTFKILTNLLNPDTGNVSIFGTSCAQNRQKYLSMISYCPQFDAVGDYLTGRQVLTLFCNLRRVQQKNIVPKVNTLLKMLEITKYADIPVAHYSGGNKRKLSLAVAMVGFRSEGKQSGVILLDEPTSGVDPLSRKLLHNIIQQATNAGNSVVLSSHSMDECELLCNRMGIMVGGKLLYQDNALNIKKKYGFGFSVTIKLKVNNQIVTGEDVVDGLSSTVEDGPSSKVVDRSTPSINLNKQHVNGDICEKNVDDGMHSIDIECDSPSPNINKQQVNDGPTSTVKDDINAEVNEKDVVSDLKNEFELMFLNDCKLQDEHKSILQYHIDNSSLNQRYSELFSKIQSLKEKYSVIENYNISETTLEEAFLSASREEK